jgi:beta-glucosidase-like glycosyl hydrolase
VPDRITDLIGRINDSDKPGLLTARGNKALPYLGVPPYNWGTNCVHSISDAASCVQDSSNVTRCPTNFPSGPSFAATFDRELIQSMAAAIGMELRAYAALRVETADPSSTPTGLDCWGPVINLARDPRWGRNGEGGTEDAYAMGELAKSWTRGLQSPRPSLLNASRELLQVVVTLKHLAVNSLENTAPWLRTTFDANATFGVGPFALADYYWKAFKAAVEEADARGIMCSYNAVMNTPTCLLPLLRNAREMWGFQGYVTSDSDSIDSATTGEWL